MTKVLVIGLDGGDPRLLSKFANEGYVPTIGSLMDGGLSGTLRSTIPPHTCPAWVSSVTGVNIGKHGVFDFVLATDLLAKKMGFADSTKRKTKSVWNILSESDRKVIMLNVPVTYPPERVEGVMVSGMLTPGTKCEFTYPKGVKNDLLDMGYRIDIGDTLLDIVLNVSTNKEATLLLLRNMVKRRRYGAEFLMREFDWDFFMVVFTALDRIQHWYLNLIDPVHEDFNCEESARFLPYVLNVYREVDKSIRSLIRIATRTSKDVNVIMFSDHGFRPVSRFFFMNNLLCSQGLAGRTIPAPQRSFLHRILNQEFIFTLLRKGPFDGIIDKIPVDLKRMKGRLIPPSENFAGVFQLDAVHTKAFMQGNYIWLNKPALESMEEREMVIQEILKTIGEKASGFGIKAYRKNQLYRGDQVKNIPEIALLSAKNAHISSLLSTDLRLTKDYSESARIPSLMWCGDHRLEGIVTIRSRRHAKKSYLENAAIKDIAPTILSMFGDPIPSYMDGRPLV